MFVISILLWIISAILLFTEPENRVNRWGSATAFLYGCGGVAVFLRENVRNFIEVYTGKQFINVFDYFIGTLSALEHYFASFALLMFAAVYTKIQGQKVLHREKMIKCLLLIPPVLMFILYPINPFYPSYRILAAWVSLYVLTADFILLYSYIKEKNPGIKRQKLNTCLIIIPPATFSLLTSYILVALEVKDIWRLNTWVIAAQFVIFLCLAVKYGVVGVKLRFEKQSMGNAMKVMTSGTAILNHAIKNEVLKISMSVDNIKTKAINDSEMDESLQVITDSTRYMMEMVKRIQSQVKEIVIKETANNLIYIAETALYRVRPGIESKAINILREYDTDMRFMVICDGFHLEEALINIFNNSIEAMEHGGKLRIGLCKNKKRMALYVSDNGTGISKENLQHVFEPFFSTRKHGMNFGLGLSYCYNVMERHGGSLEVYSKENSGTTLVLNFPGKRVLNKELYLPESEVIYGHN